MADPIIPANQRDSFPLETVTGAQQASETRIVGGMVVKYWGPSATNLTPAVLATDGNGHICGITNYLDMTGCTNVVALIKRLDTAAAPAAVTPLLLQVQYRLDKATTMPSSLLLGGVNINLLQCGMVPIQSGAGFVFAASGAPITGALAQYAQLSWGPSVSAGTGANPSPVAIGSDVRFILSAAKIAVPGTNSFSLSIWGSS